MAAPDDATGPALTVSATTVLEAALRRDRLVVVTALLAVILVSWIWIVLGAGTGTSAVAMTQMAGIPDMDMMMERAVWTPGYAALIFAMWWAMMVAMMLPGATPMLLLFARVNRSQKAQDRPYVPSGIFAAGYLVAWGGFSLLAAGLQWGLEQLDLLGPMMTATNYWLGGAILLAAGLWQLTPIKGAACAIAARRWPSSHSNGGPAGSEPFAWGSSTAPIASAAAGS